MTATKQRPASGGALRAVSVAGGDTATVAHDDERALRVGRAVLEIVEALGLGVQGEALAPTYYSKTTPPPACSWRVVLEAARRGEIAIVKRGRTVLVQREAFDAWLAGGRVERRERPRLVAACDANALEQMGVRLRGVR